MENAYNFDNSVTDNLTLYAKWVEESTVESESQSSIDNNHNNLINAAAVGGVGATIMCVGGVITAIVIKKRHK